MINIVLSDTDDQNSSTCYKYFKSLIFLYYFLGDISNLQCQFGYKKILPGIKLKFSEAGGGAGGKKKIPNNYIAVKRMHLFDLCNQSMIPTRRFSPKNECITCTFYYI